MQNLTKILPVCSCKYLKFELKFSDQIVFLLSYNFTSAWALSFKKYLEILRMAEFLERHHLSSLWRSYEWNSLFKLTDKNNTKYVV